MTRPIKLWQSSRHIISKNAVSRIELAEHPTRDSLVVLSVAPPGEPFYGFSLTNEEAVGLYTKLGKWLKEQRP